MFDENYSQNLIPTQLPFQEIQPVVPSISVKLPESLSNPVDMYINSLKAEGSRATAENSLRSVVRLLAQQGFIPLDPTKVTMDDVRNIRWHEFTVVHVETIRSIVMRTHEPAGAHLRMSAVRGVLKKAWAQRIIDSDEYFRAIAVDPIRVLPTETGRALSDEEIDKLLSTCEQDESILGVRNAAIIAVMLYGGLRRGEVVSLDVGNYNPAESSIYIRHSKEDKSRHTYLCDDGAYLLERWLKLRETILPLADKRMFVTFHSRQRLVRPGRMTVASVNILVKTAIKNAGILHANPHDFRRTFATKLLENGADVLTVQALMGHSKTDTTKTYDKRPESAKRGVVGLLQVNRRKAE